MPDELRSFQPRRNPEVTGRPITSDAAIANEVREAGHELLRHMSDYFVQQRTVLNEIILVPLIIFSRIVRTHDAINALIRDEFYTEAAVLLLTQFELRLDIAYTASEIEHATRWLSHEERKWQVMSIPAKIKALFPGVSDEYYKRLKEIVECLHGIKHGNPIYSELGFPVRHEGRQVIISTGEITDGFSKAFGNLMSLCSSYQLGWSSQVLNVCTAKYTKIDPTIRHRVRELERALHPVEESRRSFVCF
jgi:hypothetical protein